MYDDELEDDELDAKTSSDIDDDEVDLDAVDDLDGDDTDVDIDDSVDDESDAVVKMARTPSKSAGSVDLPSLEAKKKDRDALAQAMEEFLARGGKVQEVDNKIDV